MSPLLLLHLLLPASSSLPNIVVMVADDLGWNDLSWHNPQVVSPNLGQLAAEGVKLEQHYSQSVCTPTRGALMTGRYPIHIGLHRGIIKPLAPHGLTTNVSTLAELLLDAGYTTQAVGKWHLGFCNERFLPTNRGFQHHHGFWLGAQDYFTHSRAQRGSLGYDFRDDLEVDRSARGEYSTTLFGREAANIVRTHNQTSPLFLYLPFQAPHDPLQAPQEYIDLYDYVPDQSRRTYLGMVTAMDDAVGEVVDSLKQSGMYENTLILFLSDNGGPVNRGANNWPLRGSKGTLWEGGTRTMAFLHQTGVLSPRVEHGLVHVTDWLPTLLEAAGVSPPPSLDGVSHWAGLQNQPDSWARTEMLYAIKYSNKPQGPPVVSALRQGRWKYLGAVAGFDGWQPAPEWKDQSSAHHYNQQVDDNSLGRSSKRTQYNQLFDLDSDPLEMDNLADSEVERVEEMQARILELTATIVDVDDSLVQEDPAGKPDNFGGVWSTGWC